MSLPQRKNLRHRLYNYSDDGWYFVTICTQDKKNFFGEINPINAKMNLNIFGKIVKKCWLDLPNHYINCILDEFIIMPNHLHGIIFIDNDCFRPWTNHIGTGLKPIRHDRTGHRPVPTDKKHSLSEMIRGFKTFSSKKINKINPNIDFHWQRSFYDRVIRSQKELENIRHYIYYNPTNWAQDGNNPINFKK